MEFGSKKAGSKAGFWNTNGLSVKKSEKNTLQKQIEVSEIAFLSEI